MVAHDHIREALRVPDAESAGIVVMRPGWRGLAGGSGCREQGQLHHASNTVAMASAEWAVEESRSMAVLVRPAAEPPCSDSYRPTQ